MSREVCKHNKFIADDCEECEQEAELGMKKMGFKMKPDELEKKKLKQYWDEAVETLNPGARYNRWIDCWIFKKGSVIPDYLKDKKRQGRVLVML